MTRIAVAALEQETNTFSRVTIGFDDFDSDSILGGFLTGASVLTTAKMNLPIGGFINAARGFGWQVVPLVAGYSEPGGKVSDAAFERLTARLVQELKGALPLDGVFLNLHGAMVTESFDDAEAEIVKRVRAVVGLSIPIIASLDLHANISEAFVNLTDGLTSYRHFPHIDCAETGARAARLMAQRLATGRFASAFAQLDFLIPPHMQGTLDGPMRDVYHEIALQEVLRPGVFALSFNCGFNAADVPFCGPSLLAYGDDQKACDDAVADMVAFLNDRRTAFVSPLMTANDAVEIAITRANREQATILADVQDNPGGGSGGDCTEVLRALIEAGSPKAAIGTLHDPDAAQIAFQAGVGATMSCAVGGKFTAAARPFQGEFTVEALLTEPFRMVGPMNAGMTIDMGPSTVLRHGETRIIVCSNRIQCLDRGFFISAGIDPTSTPILSVKSTLHYRNDFDQLGAEKINVAGHGDYKMDPRDYPFKKLRSGVSRWPLE